MRAKTVIAFFAFFLQWQCTVFAQDAAKLNMMSVTERIAWVVAYNDQELCQKDSAAAFRETSELLKLADKWDASEFAVEVYSGQGKYRLQVLQDPENALKTLNRGVKFSFARHLDLCAARLLLQIAGVYRASGQPILAYEYFIRAHNQFVKIGFPRIRNIDQYELEIARFLFSMGDFPTALDHLAIADLFPGPEPAIRYEIQLLTARCNQKMGRKERILACFQKSLQVAQNDHDTAKMAATSVAIGEYYMLDRDYSEARIYLTMGYNWAMQDSQSTTVARSLVQLAKVNAEQKNFHAAAQKLSEAENFLQSGLQDSLLAGYYQGWRSVKEGVGDFREAYRYGKLYDHLQDSINKVSLQREVENIQLRLDAHVHLMQVEQTELRQQEDNMFVAGLFLAMSLLLLLGVLLYRHFRGMKKDLFLAREETEKALETVEQWKEFKLPIGFVPSEEGVIPQARATAVPLFAEKSDNSKAEAMEQIRHLQLLTEEDSQTFRQSFEKIHPGFFAEIHIVYPDLTPAEIRLLALTKLHLKTREMSVILKIEPNSVRRLRNRIRQKLHLPAGDNFENILLEP